MIGRIARTILVQLYVSVTIGSLWLAAQVFTWPTWVAMCARIAAAVTLAAAALFLAWWTRNLGDGIPLVGTVIRGFVWTAVTAVAVVGAVIDWRVGVQSLAFLIFVAGKTSPTELGRLWRWLLDAIASPARGTGPVAREIAAGRKVGPVRN